MGKLTVKQVQHLGAGKYDDGDGLRLYVTEKVSKRTGDRIVSKKWVYRYTVVGGKRREMGLGSASDVGLAEARREAEKLRVMVREGKDPIDHKTDAISAVSKIPTFTSLAGTYIRAHRREWSNPKHARQWVSTLKNYARPVLGNLPVDKISMDDVLRVLRPIWHEKTETASRVQKRIERVMDLAVSRQFRQDNPARWVGGLKNELSSPAKVKKQRNGGTTRHHPAMPYQEVPGFYQELAAARGVAALALRFTILTATRTGEVLGATWSEINTDKAIWTIPATRMKAKREHRVPLTDEALTVLTMIPRVDDWVFPGARQGRPLSNMSLLKVMRDRGYGVGGERGDYVPHGFRSSFRDWAGEVSHHPREIAEAALAHVLESKTEAAYQRGDLLVKRQRMMADWSAWVLKKRADVIDMIARREAAA